MVVWVVVEEILRHAVVHDPFTIRPSVSVHTNNINNISTILISNSTIFCFVNHRDRVALAR